MSWTTDLLKEIPLSAIQRERLELEGEKREFEVTQIKAKLDASEARATKVEAEALDYKKRLETEQQNHALTRKQLDAARATIDDIITNKSGPFPVGSNIPKRRGVF